MATIGSLTLQISAESAALRRELDKSARAIGQFTKQAEAQTAGLTRAFTGAATAAKNLAAGLGIGLGIGAVTSLAALGKRAIDTADSLGDVAKQVGVSTTALQALQHQARQSGSTTEALNSGLATFARSVGQAQVGTGRLLSQLEKLDPVAALQVQTARNQEAALAAVADAIERADTAAGKSAISVAAFGDAGKTLVSAFAGGADEIAATANEAQRLGLIMDQEVIAAAQRTNDEIDRLSTTIGVKLTNSIGLAVVEFSKFTGLLGVQRTEELQRQLRAVDDELKSIAATAGIRGNIADVLKGIGLQGLGEGIEAGKLEQANELLRRRAEILNQLRLEAERVPPVVAAQAAVFEGESDALEAATRSTADLDRATRSLLTTFKSDAEGDLRLRQLQSQQRVTEDLAKAERDRARLADQAAAEAARRQQQTADALAAQSAETQRALMAPVENFLQATQSATADTFRTILDGGVTTFDDLFDTALNLAKDFASQMAALLVFRPELIMGAASAAGAAPSLAGQLRGGPISLSQPITGVPAGQPVVPTNWLGIGGSALAGGLGGALLGSQLGGSTGAIGGGLGGAAGAGIGFALGGPFGALAGGLLGSVGGGFLGSLFGGGDDKTKGSFSGGIGRASTSGDSQIASIVKKVDQSILSLLDSRQRSIAQGLKSSGNINVKGGLSASDIESISSERIGAVAKGLGFNRGEILRGDAEQALKNLETAIQLERTIEDLTGAVSPFERQLDDLANQFRDADAEAKRFGISTAGLSTALNEAIAELEKAQDQALVSLLDPFEALSAPLEAFKTQLEFAGLNPAEQFARAQADFDRIAGLAEGGNLAAINQLQDAGSLLIDLAERVSASPGAAAARAEVLASTTEVLGKIDAAQREAAEDITDEIERHRREEIARLDQLVQKVEELIRETKRGNRI